MTSDASSRPAEPGEEGKIRRHRAAVAAVIAALLGGIHAAVSALWLAGSTLLLDTVGGEIEEWGRQRSAWTLLALAGVVVIKSLVALSALVFAHLGSRWLPAVWFRHGDRPVARFAGWAAAIVLVTYGAILTIVGLLVQSGAVDATSDADHRALAWHAYFWDPWFLCWGLALATTLRWTRRSAAAGERDAQHRAG